MRLICFDDGPTELTHGILDDLAASGVTATFAVVGLRALERPELLCRMRDEGHTIANHTMSHTRLDVLNKREMLRELTSCAGVIGTITGTLPTVIRPPFGGYNELVEEVAHDLGCTVLRQSSMGDYLYEDVNELVRAAEGYKVFLGLHDYHPQTAMALSTILQVAA